jgi:hypothetical protein
VLYGPEWKAARGKVDVQEFYSLKHPPMAFDDQNNNITDMPTTSEYTHEQESEMLSSGVGLIPQMVSVRSR